MKQRNVEIIHLASTHRADDPRIFQRECRTLAQAGYRVKFILPHPCDEIVEGVQIRGIPIPPDGRTRLLRTPWHIWQAARAENPSAVFHVHDAELILVMFLLKIAGRCVVYDAHEDTPLQIKSFHWIPRLLRPPISWVMRLLEKLGGYCFDGVIVSVPSLAARYPPDKTVTIRNYPELSEFTETWEVPYHERPPNIAYVGGLSKIRGLYEMVRAMDLLPKHLGAHLLLGGQFYPSKLHQKIVQEPGWRHVKYMGWLDRPAVSRALGRARVGLVVLHPTDNHLVAYPTKLFEYMAAGLPVVVSDFPGWRPFVEETQCGLLVDPYDVEAIAAAITWLLEHPEEAEAMGRRGREAVVQRFNWSCEGRRLLEFYAGLEGSLKC